MKIAFLHGGYCRTDRLSSWSGSPYFMRQALEGHGYEIHDVLAHSPTAPADLARKIFHRVFKKKRYLVDRSPAAIVRLRRIIERTLFGVDHDIIFAASSLHIAASPAGRPAAFWTDACFAGMHGFYDSFSNLHKSSIKQGHEVEKAALRRATCAFYSSEWAADTATRAYVKERNVVSVIPFGANLLEEPALKKVEQAIEQRDKPTVRLLFMGVDWKRKGGDFAIQVAQQSRARGIPVELDIVGCNPPKPIHDAESWVRCWGFISKKTTEGRRLLEELMLAANWLILPTQAECYGLVFAEAAAHGLPSLANQVGGVPTAVCRDRNGFVFPLESGPADWADVIEVFHNDRVRYRALAHSSRAYYTDRLNWRVAGETVARALAHIINCPERHSAPAPCNSAIWS